MVRLDRMLSRIDSSLDNMVKALIDLCRIPAIGPQSNGQGEHSKALYIEQLLSKVAFDEVRRYDSPDSRVPSGTRPNIVAIAKGKSAARKLWIVSHMDTVPAGDVAQWDTDPYSPILKDGRIYGLGVEDNGQAIISSIYAVKAINKEQYVPNINICLAFVSDEEEGSSKGIKHLIELGLIRKTDFIIVPDWGMPDGLAIDIAEKARLNLQITVDGVQCHPARPHKGINALTIVSHFVCETTKNLYEQFGRQNAFFDPPWSTFEPTGRAAGVSNINTIAGKESLFLDCRVLPEYSIDDVFSSVVKTAADIEKRFCKVIDGTVMKPKINVRSIRHERSAPITAANSPVVKILMRAIQTNFGHLPKLVGTGSNTCALFIRQAEIPAVAWTIHDQTAHRPNEYVCVENLRLLCKTLATAITTSSADAN